VCARAKTLYRERRFCSSSDIDVNPDIDVTVDKKA